MECLLHVNQLGLLKIQEILSNHWVSIIIVLLDCNETFFNFRLSNLIKMVYYTTLINASTTCKKFRPVITICLARMSMLHTFFTIHRVESSHGTAHISSRQFFATLCNFFEVIFVQSRSLRSRPTSWVRLSDKSDYKSLCRSTSLPSEHLSQVKLPHPKLLPYSYSNITTKIFYKQSNTNLT